jgi:hypothetical protein
VRARPAAHHRPSFAQDPRANERGPGQSQEGPFISVDVAQAYQSCGPALPYSSASYSPALLLVCCYKHCLVSAPSDPTAPNPPPPSTFSPTWILSIRPPKIVCRAHLRAMRSPMMALVSLSFIVSHTILNILTNTFQASSASTHGSSLSPALCALATQKHKNGSRSWTQTRVDWRSSHAAMSALASMSHPTTQLHTASGHRPL